MYEDEVTGRCKGCKHLRVLHGGSISFPACTHEPYKGKWTREIEHCPKTEEVADGKNHLQGCNN